MAVEFSDGCYTARVVERVGPQEAEAFERLRFDYFVRQRGWVRENVRHPGRERDRYDEAARHLAVFRQGRQERMVAYLRVLPWQPQWGFMLENEFQCLLPAGDAPLLHGDAVELTRLVLAPPAALARREVPLVTELLLKLLYHLAWSQGWQHFYIVVEQGWLPLFARRFGLSFEPLGRPCTFPDGTATVAAQARLGDLEDEMAQRYPAKHRWYREP